MLASARLDSVFSALGDPTRRQIIERLARGAKSISEVAVGFPMSQPAISKHVRILEDAGLVKREVTGRVHELHLSPAAIEAAASWMDVQRRYWNAALDRLDAYLAASAKKEKRKR